MNATQILPFFVLVLLAVAVPVHAQTRVVAKIPFDFIVHGHEFPAGTYEVRFSDSADGIALIDNLKSNAAMFTITVPAGGSDPAGEQPALVFDHRENRRARPDLGVAPRGGTRAGHRCAPLRVAFSRRRRRRRYDRARRQPATVSNRRALRARSTMIAGHDNTGRSSGHHGRCGAGRSVE